VLTIGKTKSVSPVVRKLLDVSVWKGSSTVQSLGMHTVPNIIYERHFYCCIQQ